MPDSATVVDILLVEDNDSDAELCIRALRKHKLANHLVRVKDGAEALDLLFSTGPCANRERPSPKVVLLDLRLPKVDGLEVLQRVKADERTRTLPIVVVTSSKEDRDIVEAYGLGVNSFISKPVEFEAFVDIVGKLGFYWLVVNRPPA
ncbi:MAG TPA: response regulator [Acetobacteraceae bacterium]|nr:response regulator [Acetobacteraceae bacterium]